MFIREELAEHENVCPNMSEHFMMLVAEIIRAELTNHLFEFIKVLQVMCLCVRACVTIDKKCRDSFFSQECDHTTS